MGNYYCNRVVVKAPGKVNLSLDVVGVTEQGYHLMEMVMQAVDLSDILVVGKRPGSEIRVTCSRSDVPEDDTNIAAQAARAFFAATGLPEQGLAVHIDKVIPIQAGLGGGSADGAAVLCAMNRLFETGLTLSQLCEIGLAVGADVPFCLQGGTALAQGLGERLTPLPLLPDCVIAIAKPAHGISTRYAFKLYDEYAGELVHPDTASMRAAVEQGSLAAIGRNMFNVFEEVEHITETELLKGIMLCDGAAGAVLSGSGSAVIGLFAGEREAKTCLRNLKQHSEEVFLVKPVAYGAQVLHVS